MFRYVNLLIVARETEERGLVEFLDRITGLVWVKGARNGTPERKETGLVNFKRCFPRSESSSPRAGPL